MIYLGMNTLYVSLGIIVIVVIGFLVLFQIERKRTSKFKDNAINELKKYGKIEKIDQKLIFTHQDQTVEILFFVLKNNEELIINSRVMWEVFQFNKAMLIDQTEFLKSDYIKWIIIFPGVHRIKRFINENELVFVQKEDFFYDYKIILNIELKDFLEDLVHGV